MAINQADLDLLHAQLDAKIMAAVLFDYLETPELREVVQREHGEMAGLFDQYMEGLRAAYAEETGIY